MYNSKSYGSPAAASNYGLSPAKATYGATTPSYWSSAAKTPLMNYTSMGGSRPYAGGNTSPGGLFDAAAFARSLGK